MNTNNALRVGEGGDPHTAPPVDGLRVLLPHLTSALVQIVKSEHRLNADD